MRYVTNECIENTENNQFHRWAGWYLFDVCIDSSKSQNQIDYWNVMQPEEFPRAKLIANQKNAMES